MSDFSEGMLEKSQFKFAGHPKIQSIDQADSCTLPYPDESFDAIISNQVIQHMETAETRPARLNLRASCQEAYRVLKPGGKLAFSVWEEPAEGNMAFKVCGAVKSQGQDHAQKRAQNQRPHRKERKFPIHCR